MNIKIKLTENFLFIAFISLFLNNAIIAQETAAADFSLIPTEFPLEVHYIDKKLETIDVSTVEDILYDYEPLTFKLMEQKVTKPFGGGSVQLIELKAFHNGEWIYFLFFWQDISRDAKSIKHEQYRDAAAILFPVTEISADSIYSPRMGDIGKPVNIWHWKADWEEDLLGENSDNSIEAQYTGAVLENQSKVTREQDETAGGWGGGNMLSNSSRGRSVEDLNAEKFGTLTTQEHQDVYGNAAWSRNIWTVVMARKLSTPDKNDIQLKPGQKSFFSLAVWNGSSGDRDGQKSVSDRWHPFVIEAIVN
jgi:DMSO reductase family type II enzyme heme b subunit